MVLFQQAMLRICMNDHKTRLEQEKENKNEVKFKNINIDPQKEESMSPKTKHNFIRNKSMDNFMKYSWTWTI